MTERLLMADVQAPGEEIEAEPVVVRTTPSCTELELDDGTRITFDRQELRAAIVPGVAPTPRRD